MSKRFYISKIIGTGEETDPYRPKVADYGVPWVGVISSNEDGTPKYSFAFVVVRTQDHTALLADQQIKGMPELSLDAQISSLPSNVRQQMLQFVTDEGIDTSGLNGSSTMRQVLRRIGQHLVASFNENRFDVKGD